MSGKWIAIADNKPVPGTLCLTIDEEDESSASVRYYDDHDDEDGAGCWTCLPWERRDDGTPTVEITHWMPIPPIFPTPPHPKEA